MSNFQVGYAYVNINPPLGIAIAGYYVPRYASGFYDADGHGKGGHSKEQGYV